MLRGARGWAVLTVLAVVVVGGFGCIGGTSSTRPNLPVVQDPPGPVTSTSADTAAMYAKTDIALIADAETGLDAVIGGFVTNGLVTVRLPAGALSGNDSVKIVMAPGRRLVFDVVVKQANHNHFLVPAQLEVDLSGQAGVDQPGLYWLNPADSVWYGLTSSSYDSTTHILSAPLTHFSTYGAGGKAGW